MNNSSFKKYMGKVSGFYSAESTLTVFTGTTSIPANAIAPEMRTAVPGKMEIDITPCGANAVRVHLTNHHNRTAVYPEIISAKKTAGAAIEDKESYISFINNLIEVRITKNNPANVEMYFNGKFLTSFSAFYEAAAGAGNSHELIPYAVKSGIIFQTAPNESYFGMGGGNFASLGGTILKTGTDSTSCSHIPFFLSSNSYGVLVNTAGEAEFDFCSGSEPETSFSVQGEEIEFIFMTGSGFKGVLGELNNHISCAPFSPSWSYGLCVSIPDNFSITDEEILAMLDGCSDSGIKYTEIYMGKSWLSKNNSHGFTWDTSRFPDPSAFIRKLHDRGVSISLGVSPYISDSSEEFNECYDCNYLISLTDGSILMRDTFDGGIAMLDFSHLGARGWLQIKLDSLIKIGVDYFRGEYSYEWPDFANKNIKLYGSDNPKEFSYCYAGIFSSLLYESSLRVNGQGNAFALVNSTSAGYSGYSSINISANESAYGFNKMASQLKNILSYGMSGYGVCNVEVPMGITNPRLLSAWLQFAMMTPHMTIKGGINPQSEVISIIKMFISMRASMLPYLHSLTCESKFYGLPAVRPMCMEYPKDPGCASASTQYMLGSSLLIAPIFSEETSMYYVPSGVWTDLLTRERVQGPCYRNITAKNQTMPILVRPNSIITTMAQDMTGGNDLLNNVTFTAFELAEGKVAAAEIFSADAGRTGIINAVREGNRITVKTEGFGRNKRIVLAGLKNVVSVSESVPSVSDFGTAIDFSGNELVITLG